jgi:hypothetical protein
LKALGEPWSLIVRLKSNTVPDGIFNDKTVLEALDADNKVLLSFEEESGIRFAKEHHLGVIF